MENRTIKVGSINQIHARLNEDGFAVSKRLLRQLVESGQLPYVKSGNKYLINYDSVVELLLARTAVPEHTSVPA